MPGTIGCSVIQNLHHEKYAFTENEPFPPFGKIGTAILDSGRDFLDVSEKLDSVSKFCLTGDRFSCILRDLGG